MRSPTRVWPSCSSGYVPLTDPTPHTPTAPAPAAPPPTLLRRLLMRILEGVVALLFALLLLAVLWGVFTRYVMGDAAGWTEEAARGLLIWVSMLGGAVAYAWSAHLGIDVLVAGLHPRARRMMRITAHGIVALFALGVMVLGGLDLTGRAFELGQILAASGLPRAYIYLSVPIAGGLILLLAIEAIACELRGRPRPEAHRGLGHTGGDAGAVEDVPDETAPDSDAAVSPSARAGQAEG